jgi:hypothetical protein
MKIEMGNRKIEKQRLNRKHLTALNIQKTCILLI